jgi:hypothetical protein
MHLLSADMHSSSGLTVKPSFKASLLKAPRQLWIGLAVILCLSALAYVFLVPPLNATRAHAPRIYFHKRLTKYMPRKYHHMLAVPSVLFGGAGLYILSSQQRRPRGMRTHQLALYFAFFCFVACCGVSSLYAEWVRIDRFVQAAISVTLTLVLASECVSAKTSMAMLPMLTLAFSACALPDLRLYFIVHATLHCIAPLVLWTMPTRKHVLLLWEAFAWSLVGRATEVFGLHAFFMGMCATAILRFMRYRVEDVDPYIPTFD